MTKTFLNDRVTLYPGDCLGVLATLADASVDSVVCDPPYGLEFMGKDWDGADGFRRSLNAADAGRDSVFGRTSKRGPEYRAGHLFQTWCEAWAVELLRVLKPGGHLLAFSGTRTYHRMVCAIEDAGFEIRDQIGWAYGSGFPKSHDVSKGIDKGEHRAFASAKVTYFREARGLTREALGIAFGGLLDPAKSVWDWEVGGHMPSTKTWERIKAVLGVTDAEEKEFERSVVGCGRSGAASIAFVRDAAGAYDVTAPATEAAKQWEGWGTALKPAWEPIVLARRPLVGTVASNVLQFGTGAINVDGCRVETDENLNGGAYAAHGGREAMPGDERKGAALGMFQAGKTVSSGYQQPIGRWPANLVLSVPEDEYQLKRFVTPEQKRELHRWLSENL